MDILLAEDDFLGMDSIFVCETDAASAFTRSSDVDNGPSIVDNLATSIGVGSPMGSDSWSPDAGTSATFNFDIENSHLHDPLLASRHEEFSMDMITDAGNMKSVLLSTTTSADVQDSNSIATSWLTENVKVEDANIPIEQAILMLSNDDVRIVEDIIAARNTPEPAAVQFEATVEDFCDDTRDVSDQKLISLSVKQLNQLMQGRSPNDVKRLKQRRRTLKNRGYAQNCRTKRNVAKDDLEQEKQALQSELLCVKKCLLLERREKNQLASDNSKLTNDLAQRNDEIAKVNNDNLCLTNAVRELVGQLRNQQAQ